MSKKIVTWNTGVALSIAGLLSMLGRTFLDYGYVYQEFIGGVGALGLVTLFNLAFFGAWIYALMAAGQGSRRAIIANFGFNLILVIFGLSTATAFCPTPCETAWPVGEILIWSNLAIGIPAAIATGLLGFRGEKAGMEGA